MTTGVSVAQASDTAKRAPAVIWLLVAAVGLAFADASIVVLALPRVYGEFDTTIVGVSWVLTAYAAVVAVLALLIALVGRRLRPIIMVTAGLSVFAAASVACGLAGSLAVLVAGRCVQGAGAALLLAGSLPVLRTALGGDRGRTAWSMAATVGLVIGPAVGGLLTQAFDWRSIFLFQAPLAVLALAVLTAPTARTVGLAGSAPTRPRLLPNLGLLLMSGGLVGALFLSVLLVIEIWRYSPTAGAGVVTALPAGMLLERSASARLPASAHLVGGALLLGGGLSALAWLPATHPAWAVAALALCGAGLGLLTGVLDRAALGAERGTVRDGSLAVSARHAGLVLGLVLIAPVLAGSLDRATERAALAGTSVVLDARAPIDDKVRIALTMRDQLDASQRGAVPDLEAAVADAGVESAAGLAVGEDLSTRVASVLTRAFRPAFGVAAALGFAVLIPGLAIVTRRAAAPVRTTPLEADEGSTALEPPGPLSAQTIAFEHSPAPPGRGTSGYEPARRRLTLRTLSKAGVGLGVLVLGAGALLVTEQAAGASGFGEYEKADPCTAPADPYPGGGLDAGLQRITLSAVNGAACELGVSRERLVLSLDGKQRFGGPQLDQERLERALRSGLVRAVEDADTRGDLPSWAAGPLKSLVQTAPLSWLLDQLGVASR